MHPWGTIIRRPLFPQTKFNRPPLRPEHLDRSPLLDAIAGSSARVVVVSAPAGFGKSTLLTQWAASCPDPDGVAWVSIDGDDQGPRLWLAVLAALRPIVGERLDPVMDAAEVPDVDLRTGVLIALLDALADTPRPLALVLDDVHLAVADPATRDALDWLLLRLPPEHRLILATRRDPGLQALGRMRIQGDVLDVRVDDLRFAAEESERFLRDTLGLTVDPELVTVLRRRTDGWPAALCLAGLRLRLGDAPEHVARQLQSSDEDLIGDLIDEVLRSSPAHERRFIVQTSILDRFSLDLCLRVAGDEQATREAFMSLTRTSLLLTPLDGARTWFRCHHLLRDVLRQRLSAEDPAGARALHVLAGEWFESEGGEPELHEAMRHYVAAEDWDLAAELLACHSIRFVQSGALGGRAREWLAQFPADVVLRDARLCYLSALLAALSGERDARDEWLLAGEATGWDGPMPDGTASFQLAAQCLEAMLCFDDLTGATGAARRALEALPRGAPARAAVEALTAWHAHLQGDDEEAERLARRALVEQVHLPSSGLPLVAYLPHAVLGLTALRRGDLEAATEHVDAAIAARDDGPLRASPHSLPVTCAEARLLSLSDRPAEAIARCQSGLKLARGWRDSSLMLPAVLLELARAHALSGDVTAARAAVKDARGHLTGARDTGALGDALDVVIANPRRTPSASLGIQRPEQLSVRETEVLRALCGEGNLRQVADELFISRNTVKTHTRALYAKLGVASREEAVARAADLGLLPNHRPLVAQETRR